MIEIAPVVSTSPRSGERGGIYHDIATASSSSSLSPSSTTLPVSASASGSGLALLASAPRTQSRLRSRSAVSSTSSVAASSKAAVRGVSSCAASSRVAGVTTSSSSSSCAVKKAAQGASSGSASPGVVVAASASVSSPKASLRGATRSSPSSFVAASRSTPSSCVVVAASASDSASASASVSSVAPPKVAVHSTPRGAVSAHGCRRRPPPLQLSLSSSSFSSFSSSSSLQCGSSVSSKRSWSGTIVSNCSSSGWPETSTQQKKRGAAARRSDSGRGRGVVRGAGKITGGDRSVPRSIGGSRGGRGRSRGRGLDGGRETTINDKIDDASLSSLGRKRATATATTTATTTTTTTTATRSTVSMLTSRSTATSDNSSAQVDASASASSSAAKGASTLTSVPIPESASVASESSFRRYPTSLPLRRSRSAGVNGSGGAVRASRSMREIEENFMRRLVAEMRIDEGRCGEEEAANAAADDDAASVALAAPASLPPPPPLLQQSSFSLERRRCSNDVAGENQEWLQPRQKQQQQQQQDALLSVSISFRSKPGPTPSSCTSPDSQRRSMDASDLTNPTTPLSLSQPPPLPLSSPPRPLSPLSPDLSTVGTVVGGRDDDDVENEDGGGASGATPFKATGYDDVLSLLLFHPVVGSLVAEGMDASSSAAAAPRLVRVKGGYGDGAANVASSSAAATSLGSCDVASSATAPKVSTSSTSSLNTSYAPPSRVSSPPPPFTSFFSAPPLSPSLSPTSPSQDRMDQLSREALARRIVQEVLESDAVRRALLSMPSGVVASSRPGEFEASSVAVAVAREGTRTGVAEVEPVSMVLDPLSPTSTLTSSSFCFSASSSSANAPGNGGAGTFAAAADAAGARPHPLSPSLDAASCKCIATSDSIEVSFSFDTVSICRSGGGGGGGGQGGQVGQVRKIIVDLPALAPLLVKSASSLSEASEDETLPPLQERQRKGTEQADIERGSRKREEGIEGGDECRDDSDTVAYGDVWDDDGGGKCGWTATRESGVDVDSGDVGRAKQVGQMPSRQKHRVWFPEQYVSEVRERPKIEKEDVRELFYSHSDIERFEDDLDREEGYLDDRDDDDASHSVTNEERMWLNGLEVQLERVTQKWKEKMKLYSPIYTSGFQSPSERQRQHRDCESAGSVGSNKSNIFSFSWSSKS